MEKRENEPNQVKIKRRRNFLKNLKNIRSEIGDYFGVAFYLVASALVATSIWGACYSIAKSGWDAHAAAWIQAAGSIAAIIGAAWLAQAEVRRAKGARLRHFDDTARYVKFVIVQAQFESHGIAHEFVATTFLTPNDVAGWRQRAATAAIGLETLVNRSDYGHASIAHMIANAKVLTDGLVVSLTDLADVVAESAQPSDALRERVISPHRALLELLQLFDTRLGLIRETLYE
jgi:hypothetical protein